MQIQKDQWLSQILNRPSYRLLIKPDHIFEWETHLNETGVFIYCKIPTSDILSIHYLQSKGFSLIDTSVTFGKTIYPSTATPDLTSIRQAISDDQANLIQLAQTNFIYSRFHLDPVIDNHIANQLKGEWVGNFFKGQRGDNMIVATVNEQPVGFVQLLKNSHTQTLIIDLIAVDKDYQGQELASKMLHYIEKEYTDFEALKVGTQVANIPSIRFYEKQGFRLESSQYIFHYHGKNL